MNQKYTDEEIKKALQTISNMDHYEMCRLWRFAPIGSEIYFSSDYPEVSDAFRERLFRHFKGFTPEISKELAWK